MKDQRKHARISESLMISHKFLKGAYRTGSRSKDISEGGMCFPVYRSIEPGTSLELQIYIDDSEKPILAIGEVMWLQKRDDIRYPFLVGIRFKNIDVLDRGKLRSYIWEISRGRGSSDVKWIG